MSKTISKEEIQKLLPHREPMLLIEKLINVVPLKSATAIVKVKEGKFFLMVISRDNLLCQAY